MKLILDKVKFYLPVFITLLLSIIIFRGIFKVYKRKTSSKRVIEGFEEEQDSISIVNDIRTLLMNNETEYQNNMNTILEKIVSLEVKINDERMNAISPSTTTPPPSQQPSTTTPPPPQQSSTTPSPTTPPPPPPQQPTDTQLVDEYSDDDMESNVSEEEDVNEPFVDGITSCSTANCYMI